MASKEAPQLALLKDYHLRLKYNKQELHQIEEMLDKKMFGNVRLFLLRFEGRPGLSKLHYRF